MTMGRLIGYLDYFFKDFTECRLDSRYNGTVSLQLYRCCKIMLFMPPRRRVGAEDINIPLSVCPSGYRYMVCSAISSYSFGATALIFCRMFIHIMEVWISAGFDFHQIFDNDR